MRNWTLGWPQVALIAIVATVFLVTYFLPVEVRVEIRRDLGWGWAAVSTILGPLLQKRAIQEREKPNA